MNGMKTKKLILLLFLLSLISSCSLGTKVHSVFSEADHDSSSGGAITDPVDPEDEAEDEHEENDGDEDEDGDGDGDGLEPNVCEHESALNYGESNEENNGFCQFEACANPEYQEYDIYLEYQEYIEQKGGGEIFENNELCQNKVTDGSGEEGPVTPQLLVAGKQSSYFWASADNGETWQQQDFLSRTNPNQRIASMFYKDGKLYVGTGTHDGHAHPAQGAGLAISEDHGKTYTIKTTSDGLINNHIISLFVDHRGYVYAGGAREGISISKDGGDTFQSFSITNVHGNHSRINAIYVNEEGTIFVGLLRTFRAGSGGLYLSKDDGQTWIKVTSGLGSGTVHSIAEEKVSGRMYLSIGNSGLRYSDDKGQTWQSMSIGNGRARLIKPINGEVYVGTAGIPSRSAGSYLIKSDGITVHEIERNLFPGLNSDAMSGAITTMLHDPQTDQIFMSVPNGGTYRGMAGQKNEFYQLLNKPGKNFNHGVVLIDP